jgi:general secretion pathway protein E/type IV pilus assembly protein PilB
MTTEDDKISVNNNSSGYISPKQARLYNIVPFRFENNLLYLYTVSSSNISGLKAELEVLLGISVSLHLKDSAEFQLLLSKTYPSDGMDNRGQNSFYTGDPDSFLNSLIAEARSLESSDIHIEVYEKRCRVRIRIDGRLVQRYLIEKEKYPSLINKIKIVANLDISEKRLPQDGRIYYQYKEAKFDIRVSILPTLHGEKVVLRLLNNDSANIDIRLLGFDEIDLANYMEGIKKPNGILLISGPTGSGKTTTLYATLKILNESCRNVLTIEDPIEYTLDGVNQVQVKDSIGLTFASALRHFLRQDPNVIMLGEIRDSETAHIAIRLALTGHLVLSTIHTNSAWGTVSRLIDMGIPSFLLANTLNTSVAQRLVRLLCNKCKKQVPFNAATFPKSFKPARKIEYHYIAAGCSYCYNTGFSGRKAVYEVLPLDEELSEAIKNSNFKIDDLLKERKIKNLSENAFGLFENGLTSLEEIYALLTN